MKKLLSLSVVTFFFFSISSAFAQTEITENIESDTVWTVENSPYLVKNDINVSDGVTLTIQAGTIVKIEDGKTITVDGRLDSLGGANNPVVITSIHDDIGGDSNGNGSETLPGEPYYSSGQFWSFARWNTIRFDIGSSGSLNHTSVMYGGGSYIYDNFPSLENMGAINITNSEFKDAKMLHIKQVSGELSLLQSRITEGQAAIGIKGGNVIIENNEIYTIDYGLLIDSANQVTFNNNQFYNSQYPISLWLTNSTQLLYEGNSLENNRHNGIVLRGPVMSDIELGDGGLVYIVSNVGGDSPLTQNLEVELANDLSVGVDGSLSFVDGAVLKLDSYSRLLVEGVLNIQGSVGRPIIFTSLFDNQNGGAIWDEDDRDPNSNRWAIIDMTEGSVVTAQRGVFKYNSENRFYFPTLFHNRGGNLSVSWSDMRDSLAIAHKAGQTSAQNNHFSANHTGVQNFTTEIIDATNNYWDHPSGPIHSGNPGGQGSYVSDYVSYSPWLSESPLEDMVPIGASSVLFLPGIMGSYLYEDSDVCLGNGEQRRWFSISDCDQRRLFTDTAGVSINDIYTKTGIDSIAKETLGFNLYKSFIKEIDELVEQGTIADFTPLPYDWRLRLDDILKMKVDPDTQTVRYDTSTPLAESYIYKTVEEMVDNSFSGKVSIVAHSNGGLLAKIFLSALEATNDPLGDKIDNLILVGAPQVGTPDAIVSMLHGSPILHGVVVNSDTSRELLNTAPFGYHLLPSEMYFSGTGTEVDTPVISIEDGEVTASWQAQFGTEIRSLSELQDFLKNHGPKPVSDDLLHPEVVGEYLLDYANQIAEVQASWQPSESTKVYQIAGTGVETVSGLTYFTDYECLRSSFLIFGCAEYQPKLGYRINHTYDGDETVVVPSALAMNEEDGIERWWVDLELYNENNFDIVHKNILELNEIQNFIKVTIASSNHPVYEYLSASPIVPNVGERLEFQLHSPLDMFIESPYGVVSSTTVSIPGAVYRRYGEVQYISLPLPTSEYTLFLRGYSVGSFNLETVKRDGSLTVERTSYAAVPNTASSVVAVSLDDFSASTTLSMDFDGDGEVDGVVEAMPESPAVIMVVPKDTVEEIPTSSPSRKSSSGALTKKQSEGGVAGVTTSMTEEEKHLWELIGLLEELKRLLILFNSYEKNYTINITNL